MVCLKLMRDLSLNCSSEVRRVADKYKLGRKASHWHIMARKGAGAATDAAWVSLGGCPSQITAVRVYLALMARGGR